MWIDINGKKHTTPPGTMRTFSMNSKEFHEAVMEPRERDPWGWRREVSYVERGLYGEQIERLLGLLPREQLLIRTAEDLQADPAGVVDATRRFLGVPPLTSPPRPRVANAAPEMDYGSALTETDAAFLRTLYARDQAKLERLIGWRFF